MSIHASSGGGAEDHEDSDPSRQRRRYDSPVRRERANQTRERIVAAGSALVHELSTWDWGNLTFRAVAERAGVGERTVYRHFPTEADLHGAVMRRLQEEAGVDYDLLDLDNLTEVTTRSFSTLPTFSVTQWNGVQPRQSALLDEDRHRRDAILAAVRPHSAGWTDDERTAAAAMIDTLWYLPAYERLLRTWDLEPAAATGAVNWVIDLVVDAIRAGRRPGSPAPEGGDEGGRGGEPGTPEPGTAPDE